MLYIYTGLNIYDNYKFYLNNFILHMCQVHMAHKWQSPPINSHFS